MGEQLSKVVELVSPFGCTEMFLIPELVPDPEDWAWHEFNPNFKHEMQLYDINEGTFELVVFANESNKDTTAVYHNLPGVTEFRTKDLFTRHPQKPQLFKYYGRRDDIIVLANGEKFNPLPLEANVQSHPSLKGAFVVGNRRTQTALLVEPRDKLDEATRTELLAKLWPLVEESNALVSGQGRIQKGMVLCALPDKPFARTGKGTVIRRLSEAAYKDEIENLYSGSSSQEQATKVALKSTVKSVYEVSAVIDFLREIFATSFPAAASIGSDQDFFAHGLDSVQTLVIVSSLKRNLREQTSSSVECFTPRTIFQNPTLAGLASVVAAFLNDGKVPGNDSEHARARLVNELVERYTKNLPLAREPTPQTVKPSKTSVNTVALIGSTGYLGSYLLTVLLKNPEITRIYCLNRTDDAQTRQEATLRTIDKGLTPLLLKLSYMTVDLGQPSLGLSKDSYDTLASEVDVLVYNAWRLDFGLSLQSFQPFLHATRDVTELALASSSNMRIVFVSSLAAVGNLAKRTTAPEALVENPAAALDIGYGQSKHVAERILAAASRQRGVPVSVIRVGQVGGPSAALGDDDNDDGSRGSLLYADQPWISALVRTARALGCVPSHVTPLDWVPVDTVASMVHDFVLLPLLPSGSSGSDGRDLVEFFHIYPPQPQSWEVLASVLHERYGITETAPFQEWVRRLRDVKDPRAEDVARMPALKMLDYYEALGDGMEAATVATVRAERVSGVRIPEVGRDVLSSWLTGWGL